MACARLPGGVFAVYGRSLPFHAELLQLHDRGFDGARGVERESYRDLADFAMLSVREARLRSRAAEREVAD